MKLLLREYLGSGDISEACRCLQELDVPHFHHELVYEVCVVSMCVGVLCVHACTKCVCACTRGRACVYKVCVCACVCVHSRAPMCIHTQVFMIQVTKTTF